MKTYEATGKNYEEALQNGLNALHATISDVTVETLEAVSYTHLTLPTNSLV